MNYKKNSRKMTARNIVMLIGVVLGIQAGFVSHAMEEKSFQSLKKEIEEGKNEIKEVNKIPLRRRNSFTESSRNNRLFETGAKRYKKPEEIKEEKNEIKEEKNFLNKQQIDNLIDDIQSDYEQIDSIKEEIFKMQQKSTRALQNVFKTEPLLNLVSDIEGFNDIRPWFEMIFNLIYDFGFNSVDENIGKEFEKINTIVQGKCYVKEAQILVNVVLYFCSAVLAEGLHDFKNFYFAEGQKKQEQYSIDVLVKKLSDCWKKVKKAKFNIFYEDFLDAGIIVGADFDKKLDETFDKLADTFGTMLKDKAYVSEGEKNVDYYNCCSIYLLGMNFFMFISYLNVISVEQTHKQAFELINNILMSKDFIISKLLGVSKEFQEFYLKYHELKSFFIQSYDQFVCCFDKLKSCFNNIGKKREPGDLNELESCLKKALDYFWSKNYEDKERKFQNFYDDFLRKTTLGYKFFSDEKTDLNNLGEEEKNEIKEQASCLGKVVNEFLTNFNLLIKEDYVNEYELKSFTLGELKNILNAFKSKSLKKEVFLSKEIYDEFEQKVLDNESFKEALGYALDDFNGVDKTVFNKTLQKISEELRNKDFDNFDQNSIAWLSDLTYDVSELHKTFKQTGILAKVDEFKSQIKENEIKEEKNEIKEEKNEIKEEINIASNAERNRKDKEIIKESHSKLLLKTDDKASEFDKEFTELKQQFDEILKGIDLETYKSEEGNSVKKYAITDENNIKKAVELAFKMFVLIVKQISKKTTKFPVFETSFRNVLNIKFELIHIYFNKIEKSLEEVNENEKLKSKLTDSEVQWVNTFIGKMSEIAFFKNKKNFVNFDRKTGDIVNLNIDNFKKLIIFFKDIFDSWQKFIESEFKI